MMSQLWLRQYSAKVLEKSGQVTITHPIENYVDILWSQFYYIVLNNDLKFVLTGAPRNKKVRDIPDFDVLNIRFGVLTEHCSGNTLVPSGNNPLPEPMFIKFYDTIWHHQATTS